MFLLNNVRDVKVKSITHSVIVGLLDYMWLSSRLN